MHMVMCAFSSSLACVSAADMATSSVCKAEQWSLNLQPSVIYSDDTAALALALSRFTDLIYRKSFRIWLIFC